LLWKSCLLDSDGVDAKLVDLVWASNHYKWIVWKLISYESATITSNRKERWLTPRNVAAQLKYRYDVEIGAAGRSCLRRLMERDDTSNNKLLCLFVSRIFDKNSVTGAINSDSAVNFNSSQAFQTFSFFLFLSNQICIQNKCFIELSDGWYAIRALCDTYLAEYVSKKRLRIGDKIAIYSCELIGCPKDGCAPLEVYLLEEDYSFLSFK
jgi:breast cancer 2 susceptibility protein